MELRNMNGLERYTAVLEGRAPDYLPRLPILMQYAAEHIGSNYARFAADHRVLAEANLRCASDFGFDQISAISDPYRETAGFGADIVFVRDGVPRCLRPPLAGTKDLTRLAQPDPRGSERMRDRVLGVQLMRERADADYSVMGWIEGPAAEAADLRGVTQFLIDLLDDESFACELMDLCVETGIEFGRAQVQAGADTVGIGDAVASQVSPALYERLILPRERRLVESMHEAGAYVRLHICGDITHLLAGIRTLGVDVLDVDHMVEMATVRSVVGPQVVLCGNLDPASIVRSGSPAAIRQAVRRCYETVGNPFMVGAGCEIPSGTPKQNLRALCEPLDYRP